MDERRTKKAKLEEYQEFNKILRTLDYQDHHDLAANLLLVAHYNPASKSEKPLQHKAHSVDSIHIHKTWTAWPLPSDIVPRPRFTSSSSDKDSSEKHLHSEIDAAILRIARLRIQEEDPNLVSADEFPAKALTQKIREEVMTELDRFLLALGHVKYHTLRSNHARTRAPKSRWGEIARIARLSECFDSSETIRRVEERCNMLFKEDVE